MRPPALVLVWIGDRCPLPLPIALFLFWPLAAVAACACAGLSAVTPRRSAVHCRAAACGLVLQLLAQSTGLRIDVRSCGSKGVRLRVL